MFLCLIFAVPPKPGQKRPATSPAPHIPVPHHLQTPPNSGGVPGASVPNSPAPPTSSNALLSHALPSNHIGAQSPQQQHQQQQQQQHQAHQQAVAAAVQQQLAGVGVGVGVGVPPGAISAASAGSARGSFAAALRTLAKQADIKEEDDAATAARDRNVPTSGAGPAGSAGSVPVPLNSVAGRGVGPSGGISVEDRAAAGNKKRSPPSPQPPEKMARLSHTPQAAALQPELLARSGFQPYRSDERLMHPAGAFPLEAYSHFAGLPGIPPAAFLNPAAGLPYSDPLYLEHRYQLFRAAGGHHSHPHAAALYPQMASPYSHLYSMMPGAALGISPAMHDRIKLEEEHRARLAREEEREREMQREKERELREQREKEQREREREQREREREQREKEQREKEQKEKEARERKMREEERHEAARERERQQLLSATHHYSNQLYAPLNRTLLGSMMPHINLGLRGPPAGLHGLGMSHYHAAAANAQRQSPMGLNLGMPGMPGHGPSNLQHHLQQAAMGLAAHPAAAGLTHPGFSAAAALGLGPHPHSLNLSHAHLSPHHAVHQLPPHTVASSSAGPSPGVASSTAATSSSPHSSLNLTVATSSMAQTTSTLTPSSHIPTMSHYYHQNHLAAMHAAAAVASGLNPVAAHQQPISAQSAHSTSPKITPPLGSAPNGGGGSRAASSPHAMRHHIAAAVAAAAQQQSAMLEKSGGGAAATPVTHEPTTLDLTGSNSNSSNQAQSIVSNSTSAAHELNGIESNGPTDVKETAPQQASVKEDPLLRGTPPVALEKKPATPNAGGSQEKTLLPDSSPENSSHTRRSTSPPNSDNNNSSSNANSNNNNNNNNSNSAATVGAASGVGVGVGAGPAQGNSSEGGAELCPKILDARASPDSKEEIGDKSPDQQEQSQSQSQSQRAKLSPDTACIVSGGSAVTSTTSGINSPPVVSSSTNNNSNSNNSSTIPATAATAPSVDEVTTSATPIADASR
ncbi:hypothetical protein ACLKA6_019970 [Drosophila palustris]